MEAVKKVIKIDKQKCNGCGLCVQACVKGYLRMYFSKAVQSRGRSAMARASVWRRVPSMRLRWFQ